MKCTFLKHLHQDDLKVSKQMTKNCTSVNVGTNLWANYPSSATSIYLIQTCRQPPLFHPTPTIINYL